MNDDGDNNDNVGVDDDGGVGINNGNDANEVDSMRKTDRDGDADSGGGNSNDDYGRRVNFERGCWINGERGTNGEYSFQNNYNLDKIFLSVFPYHMNRQIDTYKYIYAYIQTYAYIWDKVIILVNCLCVNKQ